MPIKNEIYNWTEENVNMVPARAGVYQLLNVNKKLIYIGQSSNLEERFQNYMSTDFEGKTCKQRTRYYQREPTSNPVAREKELIEEYKRLNGGLPPCNTQDPTRGD